LRTGAATDTVTSVKARTVWLLLILALACVAAVIALFLRSPAETLTDEEKQELLRLARQQLEHWVSGEIGPPLEEESLSESLRKHRAAFVAIYDTDGNLRGCMIDRFDAHEPLAANVLRNVDHACQDVRFPPIRLEELPGAILEISVLSTPRELTFDSPEELIEALTPGLDGVVLRLGEEIATYLPYVWETFDEPETFLSTLCEKQGWPADRWRTPPYPSVEVYRVDVFREAEFVEPPTN